MESLLYVLKIIVYFLIIFLTYLVVKKSKNKRVSLILMLVCCTLFGLYSVWCGKYPYASDRLNFAFRFEDMSGKYNDFVMNESYGLYLLESVLHFATYDARVLFFTVSFLFMLITLIAYKHSRNSSPISFLFLLLSGYPIFSFYMLKQCLAMAFISLGYSFLSENKKTKSFCCLIVAIMFHEAAWIAVPLVIALKITKRKYAKNFLLMITAIVTLMFQKINAAILSIVAKIVPALKHQTLAYLDSTGAITSSGSGVVTTLKGVPFYYLLAVAFKNRKRLSEKNKEYDNYLVLTTFVSATSILSGFMYWMFRFGILFYMPVSDFSSIIYKGMNTRKEKAIFIVFAFVIPFLLSVRLMAQYYFLYGGI